MENVISRVCKLIPLNSSAFVMVENTPEPLSYEGYGYYIVYPKGTKEAPYLTFIECERQFNSMNPLYDLHKVIACHGDTGNVFLEINPKIPKDVINTYNESRKVDYLVEYIYLDESECIESKYEIRVLDGCIVTHPI